MLSLKNIRDNLAAFNEGLTTGRTLQNIILDNEAYIVDLNAQSQLYDKGVNNLGVDISDYAPYSPVTIQIKQQKGQPTNRVTLHDSGEFAGSFYLDVGLFQFEIRAGDWKTEELIKKYGRQILGLTDENIKTLIWDYIYEDLLTELNNKLNG